MNVCSPTICLVVYIVTYMKLLWLWRIMIKQRNKLTQPKKIVTIPHLVEYMDKWEYYLKNNIFHIKNYLL